MKTLEVRIDDGVGLTCHFGGAFFLRPAQQGKNALPLAYVKNYL